MNASLLLYEYSLFVEHYKRNESEDRLVKDLSEIPSEYSNEVVEAFRQEFNKDLAFANKNFSFLWRDHQDIETRLLELEKLSPIHLFLLSENSTSPLLRNISLEMMYKTGDQEIDTLAEIIEHARVRHCRDVNMLNYFNYETLDIKAILEPLFCSNFDEIVQQLNYKHEFQIRLVPILSKMFEGVNFLVTALLWGGRLNPAMRCAVMIDQYIEEPSDLLIEFIFTKCQHEEAIGEVFELLYNEGYQNRKGFAWLTQIFE